MIAEVPCDLCARKIPVGEEHFLQLTTVYELGRWVLCPGCAESELSALLAIPAGEAPEGPGTPPAG